MWIDEVSLENIKCFDKLSLAFSDRGEKHQWITLLSENGSGKSTVLQSIGLLLAGPDAASQLLPRPVGWLKDENRPGRISIRIHKEEGDSGHYGAEKKIRNQFGYSMHVTGRKPTAIGSRKYVEPGIHESSNQISSWLRQNAFAPSANGWFAVGYGAFRRLTRSHQVIVPSLDTPSRYTSFISQFYEEEGLAAFERWMIHLDYKKAKDQDPSIANQMDLAIQAINELLPTGVRYDSIDSDGRILFDIQGSKVPTISMSDGYRSILALAGDLVWRLISAFPESSNPLKESGVCLIDELDIHLHPVWQRNIASWLRTQFPNLQFIVSTHSPMVAAGAGEDALTIKLISNGSKAMQITQSLFAMSVDDILQSEAFGLISAYSPETEKKIQRLAELSTIARKRTREENKELTQLSLFIETHNPLGIHNTPADINEKIEELLKGKMGEKNK